MDPSLIALGTAAAAGATAIVTGIVRDHLGRSRRLDQIAQQLGLTRSGNHLMGERDDIQLGLQTHLGGPRRNPFLRLYTRFDPPLDLGLCIHQTREKPPRFGQGKQRTEVDERFSALSDEVDRADALVNDGVRTALQPLHGPGNLLVSDTGATINAPLTASADDLVKKLEQLLALATVMHAQRGVVSPAAALADHRASWEKYAKQNELTFFTAPLCMFGRIADTNVYAYAVRAARLRYKLEVYLRFDDPLALGLLMQPTRTVDRMRGLFGSEDIRLGDDLFDDTFTVIASNPDGVRRLLDSEVQARLLAMLQALGPLTITDDGVATRIPHVPKVPSSVPKIVTQLLDLAKLIEMRRGDQRLGPYR